MIESIQTSASARRRHIGVDDLRRVLSRPRIRRLDNGLTICIIDNPRVPVVATAVIYRAGTRDESPGLGGAAHFLEHMMFKGSEHFGPGEIDRLTLAQGGSNNAFTSHDSTVYYFTFAADRWQRALDVEVDRMAGLVLDAEEVASERQVILEEIAMYESEPWDALDRAVTSTFFAPHPYGRPVLGTREELETIDGAVLRDFHQQLYRPSNAVLVIAGDVGASVDEVVGGAFESLPRMPTNRPPNADVAPRAGGDELRRLVRHQGEVPRMLLTFPAPAATHPDHAALTLLISILGNGRSSRLHRALVDEGQLCVWVSADLHETVDPGAVAIALEVVPGVEPARVEAEVLRQIDLLRTRGPSDEEVARAKRIIEADWVFAHEKVFQQAFLAGTALALFDLEHPWRYFELLLAAETADLFKIAERYLQPAAGGVLGWSLPRE